MLVNETNMPDAGTEGKAVLVAPTDLLLFRFVAQVQVQVPVPEKGLR